MRVMTQADVSCEKLCGKTQAHIKSNIGINVVVREKTHLTVLQHVREMCSSVRESEIPKQSCLRRSANCTPASIAMLQKNVAEVEALASDENLEANRSFFQRGSRSYEDCQKLLRASFPVLMKEGAGTSHCVGLAVKAEGFATVFAFHMFELDMPALETAISSSVDGAVSMIFEFHSQT